MGTPIRYIQLLLTPVIMLGLVACNDEPNLEEKEVRKINDFLGVPEKPVAYDEATANDVAEHIVECNGNSDNICIEICHMPPGNPDNSHTKKLPLQASLAHMGHGDHLGDCDGHSEPTPFPDDDLPPWCSG